MPEDNKSVSPETGKTEAQGTEGKSEDELSKIFEDVDESKLTPEQKAFKGKLLKEYQQKTSQLGQERKTIEELKASLERERAEAKEWRDTASKVGVEIKTEKKEGLKLLDSLIEQAEPAAKENLRQIREIIRQETDVDKLKEEVSEMRKVMSSFQPVLKTQVHTRVSSEVQSLSEIYGDKIVSKYKPDILKASERYPDMSAYDLLRAVATADDFETAIATKIERQKKSENERKRNASTTPSEESLASEEVPVERDKWGNVKVRAMIEKALSR